VQSSTTANVRSHLTPMVSTNDYFKTLPLVQLSHILSSDEKRFLKAMHSNTTVNDDRQIRGAAENGYTFVGNTLPLSEVFTLGSKHSHCPKTNVPLVFSTASPSSEPFRFSLNRRKGYDGPRNNPHTKYLHSSDNVDVVVRDSI